VGADCPEDHMGFRNFKGKAILHGYRSFLTVLGYTDFRPRPKSVKKIFKKVYADFLRGKACTYQGFFTMDKKIFHQINYKKLY